MTEFAVCASRYTGKEHDAESGNDYFDARYYAASAGRFMIPDWSMRVEPIPYSKLEDPQTLNLFSYGVNNPLGIIDADGHSSCAKCSEILDLIREKYYSIDQAMLAVNDNAEYAATQHVSTRKVAQKKNSTQIQEDKDETAAKKNINHYTNNGPGSNLYITPNCQTGNLDCDYQLQGDDQMKFAVFEHVTSNVTGSDKVGPNDWISPYDTTTKVREQPNHGWFGPDKLYGADMDLYRFFTVQPANPSGPTTYDPNKQTFIMIRERGGTHGFEHIYRKGGVVTYINGAGTLN